MKESATIQENRIQTETTECGHLRPIGIRTFNNTVIYNFETGELYDTTTKSTTQMSKAEYAKCKAREIHRAEQDGYKLTFKTISNKPKGGSRDDYKRMGK